MLLKLQLVFLILLLPLCLYSQEDSNSKDSLNLLRRSIGNNLRELKYDVAMEQAVRLLKEATAQNDDPLIYSGYECIGHAYYAIGDTLEARLNYEKALEVAKKFEKINDGSLVRAYIHLGVIESGEKVNYQKGIDYHKKSIEINNKNNNEHYNLFPYMNISGIYLDHNQEDMAFSFIVNARAILEKDTTMPGRYRYMGMVKTLFGRYFLQKKDYKKARTFLEEARDEVSTEDFSFEDGAAVFKYLSQLEEKEGNYREAHAFLVHQRAYEDTINKAEKAKEVQAAGAKFKLEQYERNLEMAQREKLITDQLVKKSRQYNIILIVASIILLFGLIGVFFAFKLRKRFIIRLQENNKHLQVAKEDAERLSLHKSHFFSTVSHELRTPLYGVIGITSILLEDKSIIAHREDLKSLKFSADYLLSLINDVLLINKMDANGVTLLHTSFMLKALMTGIVDSFQFNLQQNNNTLHLNIDDALPKRVVGDSVRLSQILINLVGNAIKFNENGNVWVTVDLIEKTENNTYRIKFNIEDDGIGIPQNMQKTIFKEFSQIESCNYNYQGTGLGLSIVKKLLDLYDSEIKLESVIGKGSVFSFVIDFKASGIEIEDEQNNEEPISFSENTVHSNKDVHILVVDDNRINQKITQRILEKRHFKCSLADNGADAITLAMNNFYDLILMDIHMPEINGIEATRSIRKFNSQVPILALTAVELEEMRAKILESGMNDIILKPYDISEFMAIILSNLHHEFSESS